METQLHSLIIAIRQFAIDRDWEQFHSPKNLACALAVEAAELLEQFQWLSNEESSSLPGEKRARVNEELADVFLYLLQLSDKLDVDLIGAAHAKLIANSEKYPIDKSKGSSKKYTEL